MACAPEKACTAAKVVPSRAQAGRVVPRSVTVVDFACFAALRCAHPRVSWRVMLCSGAASKLQFPELHGLSHWLHLVTPHAR